MPRRIKDPDAEHDPDFDELARLMDDPPSAEQIKRMAAILGQDPRPQRMGHNVAESVAVACFTALAADDERMGQFLTLTGLTAPAIRDAVAHPEFLSGLLDYIVSDEPVLKAVAEASGLSIDQIVGAQAVLSPVVNWT